MNKTYRVLFNRSLGAWVAVCETARAGGKPGRTRRTAVAAAVMALSLAAAPAWAGGDGGFGGADGSLNYTGLDWTSGNNTTGQGGHGGEGENAGGAGGLGGAAPAAVGATVNTNLGGNNGQAGSTGTNAGGGGGGGADGAVTTGGVTVSGSITVQGGRGGNGGLGSTTSGGGGGSGGAAIRVGVAGTTVTVDTAGATVTGGGGGNGGGSNPGVAGHGGAAGAGIAASTGTTTLSNTGAIVGGLGGNGGASSLGFAGNGGNGGAAVSLGGNGNIVTNTGSLLGGNGGASGVTSNGTPGVAGTGGTGLSIIGDNNSITTAGSISGGLAGGGGARANAITLTGNNNRLELQSGASFTGNVAAVGTGNTFVLGGATNGSFSVAGFGSLFTGFSSFLKEDGSEWALTGTTSATTPWTVTGGALSISADGALGQVAGVLTLDAGTLRTTADMQSGRAVVLGGGGGTFQTDNNLALQGIVSGAGTLHKTGAGTLVLEGSNLYLGGTTVTAGTLSISSDANLGDAGGDISLDNGAQLLASASLVTNRDIHLGNGGGVLGTGSSGVVLEASGNVDGTGLLTLSGSGTVVLSGTNSHLGGTLVQGTGVARGNSDSFGTGAISVAAGATLDLRQDVSASISNNLSGAGLVTKTGAGELTLAGTNTTTGGTQVNAGSLRGAATSFGAGAITLAAGTTLALDDAATGTVANAILGDGRVTKTGAGATTLTGANTYTGGTTLDQGSLIAGNAGAFVQNTAYTVDGGTLDLNGFSLTASSLSGGGGTIALGGATLTVDQAGNTGLASGIGGTGALVKSGGGVLTLFGTNTYLGPTTLAAGVLQYAAAGSFASGDAYVVNGGTLAMEAGVSGTMASLSGSGGAVQLSAGAVLTVDQATDTSFAGDLAGDGSFTKTGTGALTLGGVNTLTAGIALQQGTLVVGSGGSASGLGLSLTFTGDSVLRTTDSFTSSAAITLNAAGTIHTDSGTMATISGNLTGAAPLTKTGDGVLNLTGNGNTYSGGTVVSAGSLRGDHNSFGTGTITNNATLVLHEVDGGTLANNISGTGEVSKTGSGTTTLTGNNTYTGITRVSEGTLQAGSATGLAQNTAYAIAGTLDLNDFNLSVSFLNGTSDGTVDLGTATLTANQSSNSLFEGTITGAGGLTKSGTGTLMLAGTSNYTGTTTVNGGELTAGSATGLARGDYVVNGGVLFLNGHDLSMTALSGAGGMVMLGAAALAVDQSANTEYAGVLTGTGPLGKSGTGTLLLSGDNKAAGFTGDLQILGGTLQGTVDSFGTGAITNNAGLLIDQAADGTLTNAVAGTGSLTKEGTGQVTLTGTNTWSGGTTITGGSLRGAADKFGTGAITNNALLVLDQTGDGTLANDVGGSGTVTKLGTGEVTLTGTNTWAGGTTITAGSLRGAADKFGTGAITNNASLVLDQTTAGTLANNVGGTGMVTKLGTGEVTLTGTNSYAGGTTITAGSLRGAVDVFGTGAITNNASLVLDQATAGTLANSVSGIGTVTKLGVGEATLTGTNTWSGGTTITAGALRGAADKFGTGAITNNASLVVDQATAATLANNVGGTGTVTKLGAGELTLTGTNTWAGGTTITAGSLRGEADRFGSGLITNNASLVLDQATAGALANGVAGTGTVTKLGAGEVTLTGTNTYAGGTTLTAGSLRGAADKFGTGAIANNAVLVLDQATAGQLANDVGGTGSVTKLGVGEVTLTGTNTWAGGTTITAGSLRGETTQFGSGGITNNAVLVLDQATAGTLANDVSGSGVLTKLGAGEATLTGTNTYVGGTTITAGALRGAADKFGTGAITNNASLVVDQATAATLANNVGGTGTVTKLGAGELTLAGTNTYSGSTTITAGSLRGDASRFGTGAITNNASLVVDQATAGNLSNNLGGTGTLTKLGAGALTLTGTNTYSGGTTLTAGSLIATADRFGTGAITNNAALVLDQATAGTLANGVSGTGTLTKLGAGEVTLTGTNSFSGGTTLTAGSLRGAADKFGTGAIANNATLVLDQATAGTLANAVSGTGVLNKLGTGEVTLTGTNSYSGGTTITAGSLRGTLDKFGTGTITNNASMVLDQATAGILANNVTGTGSLTKLGAGEATFSGANSYAGGTTITAGSLRGTVDQFGTGAISNNASLVLDQATAGTLANAISGTGSLTKLGAGEVTLTGTNTYSGGTTITAGSLRGDAGSFGSGGIGNNALIVLDETGTASLANAISGSGAFVKDGVGALTLNGVNTYTGGTTVLAGTLIFGSAGAAVQGGVYTLTGGSLELNGNAVTMSQLQGTGGTLAVGTGALTLDQSTSTVFAGTLTSAAGGSLIKAGTGRLQLTGNASAFLGNTVVQGGTFSVNGALGGTMTIASGARLEGTGTIGGVVLSSGATVAPGNSIGTLNVAGPFTFNAGSTYEVEVDAAGATDLIDATGVATLAGASVVVQPIAGSYNPLTNYTILTAAGGIVGTFGTVSSTSAFLDPSLSYDANNVFLLLTRNNIDFSVLANTANQRQSAVALQALGIGQVLFDAIVPLSADDARSAFDQLSGEVHASVRTALQQDSRYTREAGLDRLRQAQGVAVQGGSLQSTAGGGVAWGRIIGANGAIDGNGNAASADRSFSGVMVGADQRVGDWRVGVMGGASRSSLDVDARLSTARVDSYHLGLYGGTQSGALAIRLGASYSRHDIDARRRVVFPGLADSLTADYNGRTTQFFGELGWKLDAMGGVALEPFFGLARVHSRNSATQEQGGAAALGVARGSFQTTFTTLGLRAATTVDTGNGGQATLRGMLGWRSAAGDRAPTAGLTMGGTSGFTVTGLPLQKSMTVIEAGVDVALQRNLSLGISYSGQIAGDFKDHGLKATLAWEF